MNNYNKIKLEKIFEKLVKEFNNTSIYGIYKVYDNTGFANFFSPIEPAIIIEKIREYLKDFDRYTINIVYFNQLYRVKIDVYNPIYNDRILINYIDTTDVKEIDNGFIYTRDLDGPEYTYISSFDLISPISYPSRKREVLKFYCKGFSYEKADRIYKKYTGKGFSETTYLKYNLG